MTFVFHCHHHHYYYYSSFCYYYYYCYYYCYYYYYYYYYYDDDDDDDDDDDYYDYYDYERSLGFCPRSRLEDIRRCKKRGRRGLSWTSARQALAKKVALGGGSDGLRRVGFCAIWAGGFLPVEAAGGCKSVAGAYFRGRGACT